MEKLDGCQLPCLPNTSEGNVEFGAQPIANRIKRALARPWNYFIKRYLKKILNYMNKISSKGNVKINVGVIAEISPVVHLKSGDWVRVRSLDEIQNTLNPFKEFNGCAFLEDMKQYCGSEQRVLKAMERFLDERDYKVKKASGIVLLDGIYCQGTPVFGRCDRSCLLFWREEWLEKIEFR